MGCSDAFCALCGGPLNTVEIWDSIRSHDPEPGGMYWDYNQTLLNEEDLEVMLPAYTSGPADICVVASRRPHHCEVAKQVSSRPR